VLRSPLTGEPVTHLGPVVAVKVDDVGTYGENGLNAADVVYCEEVEGGLTRLLAVFSSTLPTKVGPVRSARQSDLELLGEYGRIALAFSGANAVVVGDVNAANVRNDSYDDQTTAYAMDDARPSPYRFLVDVATLAATASAALAKDVGFRFGAAPGTSTPGVSFAVHYPGALIAGSYAAGSYTIARNGSTLLTDDVPTTTTNVLLQDVSVYTTPLVDHLGNHTPFSVTVGTGQAMLLRGGHTYAGTWSRPSMTGPTTWRTTTGAALALAPGRTWVVLVPIGSVVTTG
jgi:hypothetical protein